MSTLRQRLEAAKSSYNQVVIDNGDTFIFNFEWNDNDYFMELSYTDSEGLTYEYCVALDEEFTGKGGNFLLDKDGQMQFTRVFGLVEVK